MENDIIETVLTEVLEEQKQSNYFEVEYLKSSYRVLIL